MAKKPIKLTILGVEYTFQPIMEGTFIMGSSPKEQEISSRIAWDFDRNIEFSDELEHKVTITTSFYMLKTPITHAMWRTIMHNKKLGELCRNKNDFYGGLYRRLTPNNYFDKEHNRGIFDEEIVHSGDTLKIENIPVTYISWYDCQKFIDLINVKFAAGEFDVEYFDDSLNTQKPENQNDSGQKKTNDENLKEGDLKEILKSKYQFKLPTEAQWEFACKCSPITNSQKETLEPYSYGFLGAKSDSTHSSDDADTEVKSHNELAYELYEKMRNAKKESEREKFMIDHKIINYHSRYPNSGSIKKIEKTDVKIWAIDYKDDKRQNKWGLIDMHGNVAEWCNDWYGPYPSAPPSDPIQDPSGPETGTHRVIRGGGWSDPAYLCRSSCRYLDFPDVRHSHVGARLVLCEIPKSRN